MWKIIAPYVISGIVALALILAIFITWDISQVNNSKENAAIYKQAVSEATTQFTAQLDRNNAELQKAITDMNTRQAASDATLRANQTNLNRNTTAVLAHLNQTYPDGPVSDATEDLLKTSADRWPSRGDQ